MMNKKNKLLSVLFALLLALLPVATAAVAAGPSEFAQELPSGTGREIKPLPGKELPGFPLDLTEVSTLAQDLGSLTGLGPEEIAFILELVGDEQVATSNIFLYQAILERAAAQGLDARETLAVACRHSTVDVLELLTKAPETGLSPEELADLLQRYDQSGDAMVLSEPLLAADRDHAVYQAASTEQIEAWLAEGYSAADIAEADAYAMQHDGKTDEALAKGLAPEPEDAAQELSIEVLQENGEVVRYNASSAESMERQVQEVYHARQQQELEQLKEQGYDLTPYLEQGCSFGEARSAAKMAQETGRPLEELFELRQQGQSWQEVRQNAEADS